MPAPSVLHLAWLLTWLLTWLLADLNANACGCGLLQLAQMVTHAHNVVN